MKSDWVLILLENLPLQRDARVKRQCRSLLREGYRVAVICPSSDLPLDDDLADVRLWTWRPTKERPGPAGYALEYSKALLASAYLSFRAWKRHGFSVIQACNPPDLFFLVAAPYRRRGVRFVFDLHDLSPELFEARYGRKGLLYRLLRLLERLSCGVADQVITTNESQKQTVLERTSVDADNVTVVRNGPPLEALEPGEAVSELRAGRTYLCCWHGVMGVDEGLHLALEAVDHLVHVIGRTDCHFAFIGDGEVREALQEAAKELGVDDYVSFPGWKGHGEIRDYMVTADIGLSPDTPNSSNDRSTSMKVLEYMAAGVPVVAFDLPETRASAADAALYVEDTAPEPFAEGIDGLLGNEDLRGQMGRIGRQRVEETLAWEHQSRLYLSAVERAE